MIGDVYHKVYVMHRAFSHDVTRGHISVPNNTISHLVITNSFFMQVKNKRKKKKEKPTRVIFHTLNIDVTFILLLRNSKLNLLACLSRSSRRHVRPCYFSLMQFSLWMTLKWEVSCLVICSTRNRIYWSSQVDFLRLS